MTAAAVDRRDMTARWAPTGRSQRASPVPAPDARPGSLLAEGRAGLELAELLVDPVYYGIGVPRGDGAPVVPVPALMASDAYFSVLQSWLLRVGYRPYPSGIALGIGSVLALGARVQRQVEAVARAERRPVTLIGHSLGGALAGLVARRRPELVAHVVTLAVPHRPPPDEAGWGNPQVTAMAERLLQGRAVIEQEVLATPLPTGVRLSSIYSRDDAVVDWRLCVAEGERAASYAVRSTHSGMVWNAQVYRLLGRLLQDGDDHGGGM